MHIFSFGISVFLWVKSAPNTLSFRGQLDGNKTVYQGEGNLCEAAHIFVNKSFQINMHIMDLPIADTHPDVVKGPECVSEAKSSKLQTESLKV